MDYRKIYSEYYNLKWDSKLFEVHHIDRNKNNNDIKNLVLLPKKLHQEYHKTVCAVQYDFEKGGADIFKPSAYDILHYGEYRFLVELKSDIAELVLFQNQIKALMYDFKTTDYKDLIKIGVNYIYNKYVKE